MYPNNRAQVYKNGNPAVRCDIFSCWQSATHVVGRPDGPRNLGMNLCSKCYRDMVCSIIYHEGEALLKLKEEMEHEEAVRKDKAAYGGREFKCKVCGEVYYTPQKLGTCIREHNRAERQAAEQERLEKAKAEKAEALETEKEGAAGGADA